MHKREIKILVIPIIAIGRFSEITHREIISLKLNSGAFKIIFRLVI